MSGRQKFPCFGSIRFSCPHCGALAHQYWADTRVSWLKKDETPLRVNLEKVQLAIEEDNAKKDDENYSGSTLLPELAKLAQGKLFASKIRKDPYSYHVYNLDVSKCDSCQQVAIWLNDKMAHPSVGPSGIANEDMPKAVRKLFDEAGAVFSKSPRASAALLRLALQVLLKELGETGKDINGDIDKLLKKGLSHDLVKIMHSLRIIGNESVHPGTISVDDDPSIAETMFEFLNEVVDQLITRPKKQDELWSMLPDGKRQAVEAKLGSEKSSKE